MIWKIRVHCFLRSSTAFNYYNSYPEQTQLVGLECSECAGRESVWGGAPVGDVVGNLPDWRIAARHGGLMGVKTAGRCRSTSNLWRHDKRPDTGYIITPSVRPVTKAKRRCCRSQIRIFVLRIKRPGLARGWRIRTGDIRMLTSIGSPTCICRLPEGQRPLSVVFLDWSAGSIFQSCV